jgi:hypothetical protein
VCAHGCTENAGNTTGASFRRTLRPTDKEPACVQIQGDAMSDRIGGGVVVYIDRSDVHADRWEELKAGIRRLVEFVDAQQPQMATYGFYLDEQAAEMTVVAVHPDSASLERHIEIGAPEFQRLAPFIALREIEVFGHLSERALELLRVKAATLGDGGRVALHEQFAGFDRLVRSPPSP